MWEGSVSDEVTWTMRSEQRRLVTDPFGTEAGARLYKTGIELGTAGWQPGVSRSAGFQVKLRGTALN